MREFIPSLFMLCGMSFLNPFPLPRQCSTLDALVAMLCMVCAVSARIMIDAAKAVEKA